MLQFRLSKVTMRRVAVPAVSLVLLAAAAAGQVPAGPEFRVSANPLPGSTQRFSPSVAKDARGNFVVVWRDGGGLTASIVGQRYDAAGIPLGPMFVVSTLTASVQGYPTVSVTPAGKFTITWGSDVAGAGREVFGRRYDTDGTPLGATFAVNTYTTGNQSDPVSASDGGSRFVVVWTSYGQDGSGPGVFGQRFAASGLRLGAEFRVNVTTAQYQWQPAVTVTPGGGFVVVWTSPDASLSGIFGRRYDAAGNPLGGEFPVNTTVNNDQLRPSVAADAYGRFVVVWEGEGPGLPFPNVFGQRFDASGARLGGEFRIPSHTASAKGAAHVTAQADGGFMVGWTSLDQDGSVAGAYGQRYLASGLPLGGELRINTYTTGGQGAPEVAFDPMGNYVVTWESYQQAVPGQHDVYAQRFGGLVPTSTAVDSGGNGVLEPGESVATVPTWRNVNGATLTFAGTASNLTGPGAPNNPTYAILDASADYGAVPNGATGSCAATGDCYSFSIGTASPRPAQHWDATFHEQISPVVIGLSPIRSLHVGDSFGDVPRASIYYRFVETVLHHGVTGGCGGGDFCPLSGTPREQMAVFVLVAREGAAYQPPACVPGQEMFGDVPASSPFCPWIEELARRNLIGGCGGGNFCPLSGVSREQVTVFALATREGSGYAPPPCVAGSEMFADVPASSPFCRWVEEAARRGITGGCGGGNFCPAQAVTREQNSVFIGGAFGLTLY